MSEDSLGKVRAVVRMINRRLLSAAPFNDLLDFVFENLETIVPFDRLGIATVDGDYLQSRWYKSKLPMQHLVPGYKAPILGSSLQYVLSSGQSRIINDLELYLTEHPDSKSTKLILADGIRSSLTCPLYFEGTPTGVIFFSSHHTNIYQESHIDIFEEIADELSLVVQKGRWQSSVEESLQKDRTLSTVLHDLRSPLGVIQGFLQVLEEEPWFTHLDSSSRDVFRILERNCVWMQALIEDLKEVSQISQHRLQLNSENVELIKFLTNIRIEAEMMAARKGIIFEANFETHLPEFARFDPLRIKQVLNNLISNGLKFSWPGSQLRLEVTVNSEHLIFSVIDNGPGIPENELYKLFQEFSRTQVRPTAGEGSTGLGLYISRQLVERHGGQISVSSTVGKGSTFTFWLPN